MGWYFWFMEVTALGVFQLLNGALGSRVVKVISVTPWKLAGSAEMGKI